MKENNNGAVAWHAGTTNAEQPKTPVYIGIAVGLGALLWLAPFMGLNSVLNPQKLANILAVLVAKLTTSLLYLVR